MTPDITVVGGGYAGLSLIRHLRALGFDGAITLVDRNPYHTLLTETHQVAAGTRSPDSIVLPFNQMDGFRFVEAEATGLDPGRKALLTSAGALEYSTLVLALGSVDHDYGVPGVRAHCMMLHGLRDGLTIRERLTSLPPEEPVIIAGGGLTGVELAAHIALARPDGRSLTLVEASPSLLPGLPARLVRAARRRLGQLGVNMITGAAVAEVTQDRCFLSDGTALPFGLMIWACGVKAHPLVASLGIPTDRLGRALLDDRLSTPFAGLYVIGDASAGHAPSAQAAVQQGRALARALLGQAPTPIRLRGILVDLGGHQGVGRVGSLSLRGWVPGLLRAVNEIMWVRRAAGCPAALRYLVGSGSPVRTATPG